jgi:RNA polymerase primary sigma factor
MGTEGSIAQDVSAHVLSAVLAREILRHKVARILKGLPAREARALRMSFGLDGRRALSLHEMGDPMGMTQEHARQIVAKALTRLRHPRRSRQLRRYLR